MHRFLSTPFIALTFAVAACGTDGGTPPQSIAGTYTLQTVNGSPPPATLIEDPNGKFEILGGTYTLREDGAYDAVASLRETINGTADEYTQTEHGVYSRNGARVQFHDSDGFVATATVGNGTLTFAVPGVTAIYAK